MSQIREIVCNKPITVRDWFKYDSQSACIICFRSVFFLNVYAEAIHLEEMKRFPFLDALNSEFNMIAAYQGGTFNTFGE